MKKPIICYPRGSGGNWLSNLIWRLETDQFELPTVDVVFDGQRKSDSFLYSHIFNMYDRQSPIFDKKCEDTTLIKFSSPCWFNQYINDAIKVKYHITKLSNESIINQFHLLTDSAVYILTDKLWRKTWASPGELDYTLLLTNPDQFIDCLFSVLDKFNIKYTRNRSYCHSSLEYYKSTCPDPSDHLNNFDSLLWLAWCHAHILINKQSLSATIPSDATVASIRRIVEPATKNIFETTLPMVAIYK